MTQPNGCSVGALSSGGGSPTSAERVRALLAAADSLTVTTGEHRCDLVGLHSVDAVGRLFLWAPAHSCLVTAVGAPAGGGVPATIEVTDVAAVAVRDRVRARVAVHGSLSLNHAATCSDNGELHMVELALDVRTAELHEGGEITVVDPATLGAAEADPLAACEAHMLLHIAADHPDAVQVLTRLVNPDLLRSVVRVSPLALDRYGIVLRLERLSGHRDVRLPFASRTRDVPHAQRELNALLVRGTWNARHCRSPGAS